MTSIDTLFYIFLLHLFSNGIYSLTCQQPDGPCKCTTDEGVIDISPLDSKSGAKFVSIPGANGETYNYNPCTEFSDPLCNGVSTLVCLQEFGTWHPAGLASSATWGTSSLDSKSLAVSVTQTDEVNRITEITLQCDPSKEGEVVGKPIDVYTYKLTLKSKYACPGTADDGGGGGGGLSAGSVLLIAVLVAVIVYLVGGILFMRYSKGAEGFNMIPNVTFWTALPGLMKDGTVYVVDKVKGSSGSASSSTSSPKKAEYQSL